ncbi:MAG: AraC family transcriptional regulator [Arenicella sp.]|nr:AraC family transcriptional regulator [Arenicella sp.]
MSPHKIEMVGHSELLDVKFSGVHLDGIALLHAYYGCSIKAKPEHSKFFYTHTMLQGKSEIQHGKNQCDTIAGDTVILSPSVPYNMLLHEKCDRIVIRIDPERIKSHLSKLLCREVNDNLVFDLKLKNASTWWSTIDYVLSQIENEPRVLQSKDVQQTYAQLIISNLLELHNHNYMDLLQQQGDDMFCPQVRSAIDYIRSRLRKNTSLAELANHCNVSARTLQRSFVKHLGTSPTSYIRNAKLDAIHHELQSLNEIENGSIKRILLDFGIIDFGRFAQYYRKKFGCTPKETLAKSRQKIISLN